MNKIQNFDVAFVGSGLGSLLCANILAKEGLKVAVYEKHSVIGGNLQSFKRNGCVFETGMHYVGSLDKDQILYKIFQYLNILNKVEFEELSPDAFDRINIGQKEYAFAKGYDNFTQTLISYFPNETEAIEKYVNKLKTIWDSSNLLNLREIDLQEVIIGNSDFQESAYSFINSLTDNEELKAVLAGNNGLYAGNKEKTPLYILANINSFYINSAWRIVTGGTSLADTIASNIKELGGIVHTKSEITDFEFQDNYISSAIINGSEKVTAKYFISGISPDLNFSMIKKGKFRKAYSERIQNLEYTPGAFSLYIELAPDSFPHFNSNLYYSKDCNVWDMDQDNIETWPRGFIMYTTRNKTSEYAISMTLISIMNYDLVRKWDNTKIGMRGKDYKVFKADCAEKMLNLLELKYPEIRNCIKKIHTSTPLTYRDYTGTYEGSMYGVYKECNETIKTYISAKTRIPNFFLTGQSTNIHGMLGVAMGSLITIANIVDLNLVINKIKNS